MDGHKQVVMLEKLVQTLALENAPPTGLTPKKIVWTRNKAKLYRYVNPNIRRKTPILIIYSLINKPYILDLAPGRSFIEYLIERGFDVYLLDWGAPGPEDCHITLDDLVFDYVDRAVKHTLRKSKATNLSLLGYCTGGTLIAMYAATHSSRLRNLVFLTTPIDFSDHPIFSRWFDPQHFDVAALVEMYGNVPAELVAFGTKMLNPIGNFATTYNDLWHKLDDAQSVARWQSVNKWVNDGVDFPGAAFKQWISEFYQRNLLIKAKLCLRAQTVDLHQIVAPALVVTAKNDHIVPSHQSVGLLNMISSDDKAHVEVEAGHVGLLIGRAAQQQTWSPIADWLENRAP